MVKKKKIGQSAAKYLSKTCKLTKYLYLCIDKSSSTIPSGSRAFI